MDSISSITPHYVNACTCGGYGTTSNIDADTLNQICICFERQKEIITCQSTSALNVAYSTTHQIYV